LQDTENSGLANLSKCLIYLGFITLPSSSILPHPAAKKDEIKTSNEGSLDRRSSSITSTELRMLPLKLAGISTPPAVVTVLVPFPLFTVDCSDVSAHQPHVNKRYKK